jgi:outer membrane lipoprotein
MKHRLLFFSALLLLSACAASPLKLDGVNRDITPAMVTADHPYNKLRVVWGGMIVRTTPLKQTTQIEVLAYPVDAYGEPDRQTASLGRFLIVRPGYLEPADFAPGRWVSVVGSIGPSQLGTVGEASYRFPVILPEQLYLWPVSSGSNTQTFFHFGVGIQF